MEYDTLEFEVLFKRMGKTGIDCAKAIILLEVFKGRLTLVRTSYERAQAQQTSCGFAVPLISQRIDTGELKQGPRAYMQDRRTLGRFAKVTKERGWMEGY